MSLSLFLGIIWWNLYGYVGFGVRVVVTGVVSRETVWLHVVINQDRASIARLIYSYPKPHRKIFRYASYCLYRTLTAALTA